MIAVPDLTGTNSVPALPPSRDGEEPETRPCAEEAVRREALRTGRSQQEVIREAVNRHLGLAATERPRDELGALIATGVVRHRGSHPLTWRLRLAEGMASADLLDRDDRI